MLKQRILTALVLAPSAIVAIFHLPLPYFSLLLLAVMAIGAWEWGPLMGCKSIGQRLAFVLTNVAIITSLWFYMPLDSLWLDNNTLAQPVKYILWLAVAWWVLSALLTFSFPRSNAFWANNSLVRAVFGWLTLIPTWLAFMVLRSNEYQVEQYHGAQLLMALFILVWSADVGAYFVGKSIGKRKLMPNVSPGKTLEGFLGGVVFAVILASVSGYLLGWTSQQFIIALAVTVVITTISVLGDLSESMFKRQAGVKDSGNILPGHGGILDRIDSLTATAPIFALCYASFGW